MAEEPDNLVLQLLREIRAKQDATDAKVDGLADQVETIELKLDGLTHAVIAGFGSLVHELDDVKQRLNQLDGSVREPGRPPLRSEAGNRERIRALAPCPLCHLLG